MAPIEFFTSRVADEAVTLAVATLRSGFLSEGELVRRFEAEVGEQLGISNVVALNSGTAALHLALLLCGVRPGTEVILPAQTFVATGLAVLMCGAKPVFVDIQYDSGNISPSAFANAITERTVAVMPVHWGGNPCDMDEIAAIASAKSVSVVEDAAHALGATYRGRPVGGLSRFTAYSFQAIKHLTTGDGGALACADASDARAARTTRWFGIDRAESKPSFLGERQYDIERVGYKYHMNDLAAAVGLGNLPSFRLRLSRRREIAAKYAGSFAHVGGVAPLKVQSDRQSAWWLYTLLVERRDDFVRALQQRGIPTSVVHQRIDRNTVFAATDRTQLPNQERFDRDQIAIPVHPDLSDADVDAIITSIKAGW